MYHVTQHYTVAGLARACTIPPGLALLSAWPRSSEHWAASLAGSHLHHSDKPRKGGVAKHSSGCGLETRAWLPGGVP